MKKTFLIYFLLGVSWVACKNKTNDYTNNEISLEIKNVIPPKYELNTQMIELRIKNHTTDTLLVEIKDKMSASISDKNTFENEKSDAVLCFNNNNSILKEENLSSMPFPDISYIDSADVIANYYDLFLRKNKANNKQNEFYILIPRDFIDVNTIFCFSEIDIGILNAELIDEKIKMQIVINVAVYKKGDAAKKNFIILG
jgi:regulator of RNase E activity RraB